MQLIFDENNELTDCEIVHERHRVAFFLNTFRNDLLTLSTTSNITIDLLEGKPLARNIRRWIKFYKLKKSCKKRHIQDKNILKSFEEQKIGDKLYTNER